jgi:hypothetical protein
LIFAGIFGIFATTIAASGRQAPDVPREAASAGPVAVQRVNLPTPGLRDEAAMVLVGTALIGLAAAVRRAA